MEMSSFMYIVNEHAYTSTAYLMTISANKSIPFEGNKIHGAPKKGENGGLP